MYSIKTSKQIGVGFCLFLFLVLGGCSKKGTVKVVFVNNTNGELKEITVQNKKVGNLRLRETSKPIYFESFLFDSGTPIEKATLRKEGVFLEYNYNSFCGTEYRVVKEGSFTVTISNPSDNKSFYFE